MILVVDASVAAKWFIPEKNAGAARRLLDDDTAQYFAPSLVIAELVSSVWKNVKLGNISEELASIVVHELGKYFTKLVALDDLAPRALRLSLDLDHPVYDCFYLALAESQDCPLITADRRLYRAVQGTPWARITRQLA